MIKQLHEHGLKYSDQTLNQQSSVFISYEMDLRIVQQRISSPTVLSQKNLCREELPQKFAVGVNPHEREQFLNTSKIPF